MLSYDEKKFLSIYKLVFNKNFCTLDSNPPEGFSAHIQASNLFYLLRESMIYPMDISYHLGTYGMTSPGMNAFISRISNDKAEEIENYYRTNKCYTDKIIQKDIFDPRLVKLSLLFNCPIGGIYDNDYALVKLGLLFNCHLGGIYDNTYTLQKVTGFSSILYVRLRLYSPMEEEHEVIERTYINVSWISRELLKVLYPYVNQFILEETSL